MITLATVAVTGCGSTHAGQPSARPVSQPAQGDANLVFATPPTGPLRLDVYRPTAGPKPAPVVVFLHGGGWVKGSRDEITRPGVSGTDVARGLTRRGYAVVTADYRLSKVAKWPAQLFDAKAAVRWVRANAARFQLDPQRIGVWGKSAGGQLAAMVGTTAGDPRFEGDEGTTGVSSEVRAVIDWYGPADLPALAAGRDGKAHPSKVADLTGLFGCAPTDCPPDTLTLASPVHYAGARKPPPFLIQHGTADTLVPVQQSEELADALRKAGGFVELKTYPGASHEFVGEQHPQQIRDAALGFLDQHLR